MLRVEVFGSQDKRLCRAISGLTGELARRLGKRLPAGKINVIFVSDAYIQELNRRFLRRNRPTDVLAFPLGFCDGPEGKGEVLLGEIYISRPTAREQARRYGHSLKKELLLLVRHGVLHLAGLSHRQMAKLD